MKSQDGRGFLRRTLTTIGDILLRGISGKAASSYMRRFSGDDEYWRQAIASQLGWPGERPSRTRPDANGDPAGAASGGRAELPIAASRDAGPENEPVASWTERELDDYRAHNAGRGYAYESETGLQENGNPTGSPDGPARGRPRSATEKEP